LRALPGAPDLQAGDVVTTGTWTDAWPVRRGERWTAQFDAPLSPLTVVFTWPSRPSVSTGNRSGPGPAQQAALSYNARSAPLHPER
jgi:hypothetical protein